jgi:hypothetical protein
MLRARSSTCPTTGLSTPSATPAVSVGWRSSPPTHPGARSAGCWRCGCTPGDGAAAGPPGRRADRAGVGQAPLVLRPGPLSTGTFSEVTDQVPAFARSTARLCQALVTAVVVSGRAASEVARAHRVSCGWSSRCSPRPPTCSPTPMTCWVRRLGVDEHDGGGRHRHRGVHHLSGALSAPRRWRRERWSWWTTSARTNRSGSASWSSPLAASGVPVRLLAGPVPDRGGLQQDQGAGQGGRGAHPGRPWTPRSPPHCTPSPRPTRPAGSLTPATPPDKLPENRCQFSPHAAQRNGQQPGCPCPSARANRR